MHSSKAHNGRNNRATPTARLASPSQSSSVSRTSVTPPLAATTGAGDDNDESGQETHSSTGSGRAVAALLLQTPSTYQSLVSTLSALAPIASGSTKTVGSWGKSAYEQLASGRRRVSEGGAGSLFSLSSSSSSKPPTAAPPAPDVDRPLIAGEEDEDEDGEMGNEHARQLSASIRHRPSSSDDAVIFSSWDTASPQTRVLIQVFASGRIEIWNATSFSELCEVLNVDFKHITTSHRNTSTASALPLTARFVSTSASTPLNGHVPLLAVLASDNIIYIYSTASHRTVKQLSIGSAGQMVDFQVNERFLVAATVQPLSLHVWDLATFEPAPFSPILDVAPHPYDLTPVFCLSSSRLLAYASTIPPSSGGSGIIATSGWNEASSSNNTIGGGAPSSSATAGQSSAGSMDYGETARRWGEGMMSHMKAVTDYGYSRYYGHTQDGSSSSTGLTPPHHYQHQYPYRTSPRPSTANQFSKSAPHPSSPFYSRSPNGDVNSLASSPASGNTRITPTPMYSPRSTAGVSSASGSASSSSSVVVIDLVASMKAYTLSSSSSRPSSSSTAAQRSRSPMNARVSSPSNSNGLVYIAHFRPSKNHPLTLISINANGSLILTSSSEGHSFHVFELRPPSFVGNSAIRTTSPSRVSTSSPTSTSGTTSRRNIPLQISNPDLKVWHRYRLNRGLTVARTISAQWSNDSRFVLVSTSRGTVHVYPINPLGGKPTPETHLPGKIKNGKSLAPLSVTVNAITRIKAPRVPAIHGKEEKMDGHENDMAALTSAPIMLFVPSESLPSQGHPSRQAKTSSSSSSSRTVSLVLFYPHLHSILQSNIHLSSSPKTAPSDAPLSARVTSQAVSGLTQMMRNRGSALPTFESEVLLARLEWCAQWPLALEENMLEEDVRVDLSKMTNVMDRQRGSNNAKERTTSAHEAEIESFSHAPAVLPRSIYLAQTVTFHTYPPGSAAKGTDVSQQFSLGNFNITKQSKVVVREEVSHRFGSSGNNAFDESTELHSAMHTILDATNLSSSQGGSNGQARFSPTNPPAFPNGYGKTSSSGKWLPSPGSLASLPIPIGISPQTVRQAATKVRKYSSNMRSPSLHAVGLGSGSPKTGGASGGHSLQGSTLSFEDEDAVLAQIPPEMLEIEEEGVDLGRPLHHHQQHISSSRPDNRYGSPSPAPVPSLSVGTASSAESHVAKSSSVDSPDALGEVRGANHTDPSPPLHATSIITTEEEEARNEGEWDSFKLEGIDDEEDLRASASPPIKQNSPSPLLSHAMLPMLAAKSEQAQTNSQKITSATQEILATPSPIPETNQQKSVLAVPGAFSTESRSTTGIALDMAYKPLEADKLSLPASPETHLVSSSSLNTHQQDTTPSPLSSSPAVSSAAEFSASPATAAVLASKRNKKKSKKGK